LRVTTLCHSGCLKPAFDGFYTKIFTSTHAKFKLHRIQEEVKRIPLEMLQRVLGNVHKRRTECLKRNGDVRKRRTDCLERNGDVRKRRTDCLERNGDVRKRRTECVQRNGGVRKRRTDCLERNGDVRKRRTECLDLNGGQLNDVILGK
jgi:hypothetical protein